jgi:aminopeptidase N
LALSIQIDFDSLIIRGVAGYNIDRNKEETIHFDIQDLDIAKVFINDSNDFRKLKETSFIINKGNEYGDDLEVQINDYTSTVHIAYKTKAGNKSLSWLSPEQTLNKKAPFLYTNGFSNHTRSWIPIQDSPGIRISYEAVVKTQRNVIALMTADNPIVNNFNGEYEFFQKNPIPPYLIALAVGDLQYDKIGNGLGVYAEPNILIEASDEFANMDKMMETAESLFGPYRWNRYDILVLPPSFPFGGMENPQLSFISPTIIAKDQSLTSTIAHELAHAWSGNLVNNATWNDFWLNEGFTVYIERRIMEELKGKKYIAFKNEVAYRNLQETIKILDKEDTHLKLNLGKKNPDEALTSIPYIKGYFFLLEIEKKVGRKKMDIFLRNYFDHFAFQSITTEDFLNYLTENLLQKENIELDIEEWVYSPGLPEDFTLTKSELFDEINENITLFEDTGEINEKQTDEWSTYEWIYFMNQLPPQLPQQQLEYLDRSFHFSESSNALIQSEWFEIAITNNYTVVDPYIENYLNRIGRVSLIKNLYKAYIENNNGGLQKAQELYKKSRPLYHSFTTDQLDKLLEYEGSNLPSDS